ncbi:unnamed protein product, partial [Didymodactylos carnosus]
MTSIEGFNTLVTHLDIENQFIKKLTKIDLNNNKKRWKSNLLNLLIDGNDKQKKITHNEAKIIFVDKSQLYIVNDNIPFAIPRSINDVRESMKSRLEKSLLSIKRNEEYINNTITHNDDHQQVDTSVGLLALAQSAQKIAFREILSVDESRLSSITLENDTKQKEKYDPITDFSDAQDLIEFENVLTKHGEIYTVLPPRRPIDMLYMKFCCLFEISRDSNQNCLNIQLHDIIFKFQLTDFILHCGLHIHKPVEQELILERKIQGISKNTQWGMEMKFVSFDWIENQEVELYFILKVESLPTLTKKFIKGTKFHDQCHLHVKNIPHESSKIFLREMIPVCRSKMRSRGYNVGQIEFEAVH